MVNCLEYDPYTIYPFQLQWNLYSGDTQGPGQVFPKKRLEFGNNLPQKNHHLHYPMAKKSLSSNDVHC